MEQFDPSEYVNGQFDESGVMRSISDSASRMSDLQSHGENCPTSTLPENGRLSLRIDPGLGLSQYSDMPTQLLSPSGPVHNTAFDYDANSNIRFEGHQKVSDSDLLPSALIFTGPELLMNSRSPSCTYRALNTENSEGENKACFTNMDKELLKMKDSPVGFMEGSTDKIRVKSAHNVIEQRYRNKINEKFDALQFSVPTLRALRGKSARLKSEDHLQASDLDDLCDLEGSSISLEGLEPATKLNKGTILAKTVEYIKFLERKNKLLSLEHQQLVNKAQSLGLPVKEEMQKRGN